MCGDVRNRGRIHASVPCVIFLATLIAGFVCVLSYFYLTANRTLQNPCHENLSVPLSNPIFHPNGSLEEDGEIYPLGYHFTANGTTRGCLCVMKPCIRKCCGKDEYYVRVPGKRARCEKTFGTSPFENFSFPVYTSSGEQVEVKEDHFRIVFGDVCRHGKFLLSPDEHHEDKHDLMVDGRLRLASRSHRDVSEYCLESMNGTEDIRTFVCFTPTEDNEERKIQFLLYPIAMLVSIPFLLATIFVYSVLPSLRNIHGKALSCQCASLAVTYVGFTIIQFKTHEIDHFWCVLLAFVVQFWFLGSFCWLNVMSFDIWWSFSGLRPPKWGLKETEHKKFLLYSLYAWGIPLIIVAASVAVDMTPSDSDTFIRPHFGELKCWYADWEGASLYFYLPIGILLGLNTVMFVTTAFKLRAHTKNNHDKDRFHLYVRLFIVMGLNWILELLSFYVGGPISLWFITDICNALQGVVIFFFFVCKRKILHQLNKQLCPNWKLISATSPENSNSLSGSVSMTKTENVDVLTLNDLDCATINSGSKIESQSK